MKKISKLTIALLLMCLLIPVNTFADAKDDRIAELEEEERSKSGLDSVIDTIMDRRKKLYKTITSSSNEEPFR